MRYWLIDLARVSLAGVAGTYFAETPFPQYGMPDAIGFCILLFVIVVRPSLQPGEKR